MTKDAVPLADPGAAIAVSEIFYSHQGEGVNHGRKSLFLRLMDCNLTCGWSAMPTSADAPAEASMVCDTRYTWDKTAFDPENPAREMTRTEIRDELQRLDPHTRNPSLPKVDLLVVTGGEPLLKQGFLVWLADMANASGLTMEIETNATILPSDELVKTGAHFNCGLKLANCGVREKKRIRPEAIRAFQSTGRARWKFVVTDPADLDEVVALREKYGLTEVWLSPEGTTVEAVVTRTRMIARPALALGLHLTNRLQILTYGDKRGT